MAKCEHGVEGGCMACRACWCGCRLDKHFIRYEHEEGKADSGCTLHADCEGYRGRAE
jgi:hypothetical protein